LLPLELALSDLLQLTDSRRRTAKAKKEKRNDFKGHLHQLSISIR
jgi:hypothetical protein